MTSRDGSTAPESHPEPQQPHVLAGRYVVGRELGRGTMGVVYEAEDTILHRTVAIKTIELAFAVGPRERADFEERFFTEARVGARLSHPGIVVCHDVGKDPDSGRLFIVFERLRGQTLSERVARGGPLPWPEALTTVAAIARAIHHAHEHGIVHRDLKPANVMRLDSGTLKLLDFGIARMESMRARLTAGGQSLGSPLYMSPEQALGHTSDARSDIFSLSSILGTLLLGRPWFDAPSIPQILARVIREEPPAISTVVAGAPPELDLVVARAAAKKADDRYGAAAALADDLEDVLAGRLPRHASRKSGPSPEGTVAAIDPEAILAELTTPGPVSTTGGRTATVDILSPLLDELLADPTRPAEPPRRPRPMISRVLAGLLLVGLGAGAAYVVLRTPPSIAPLPTSVPAAAPSAATPVAEVSEAAMAIPESTSSANSIAAPTEIPAATAAATAPPTAAPTKTRAPTVLPSPRSGVRIDVEHAIKNGSLNVWIDGALVFETRLQVATAKRILAWKVHEGRAQKSIDIHPGRHEVRVEVGWDGNNRRGETKLIDVPPNSTGTLKIRIGRASKDLSIDWIWDE
jgi:eukaryotic-like serine/threonine-protein kinase